jgi:hypothetical protein
MSAVRRGDRRNNCTNRSPKEIHAEGNQKHFFAFFFSLDHPYDASDAPDPRTEYRDQPVARRHIVGGPGLGFLELLFLFLKQWVKYFAAVTAFHGILLDHFAAHRTRFTISRAGESGRLFDFKVLVREWTPWLRFRIENVGLGRRRRDDLDRSTAFRTFGRLACVEPTLARWTSDLNWHGRSPVQVEGVLFRTSESEASLARPESQINRGNKCLDQSQIPDEYD